MVRETIETPITTFNSSSHGNWSTKFNGADLEKLAISRIDIGINPSSSHITHLKFTYNQNERTVGFDMNVGDPISTVKLEPDEWIQNFDIGSSVDYNYTGYNLLSYIKITTNKKSHGPYGISRPSNAKIIEPGKEGFGALWLSGSYLGNNISSIQITWATYPIVLEPPSFLKFYNGNGPASFRKQLTPMITLVVGKSPSRLTVHEGIVERLPFLSNSSLGETRKRSSGSTEISMPDDDAAVIVALIEFLKTGSYTYEHADPDSIPAVDFAQGVFHLDLYATATKYKCPELADAALKAVIWVLSQLSAIDSLKMWQAGYKHGLSLDQLEPKGYKGLKSRLKELLTTDKHALTKLVTTCPALASDLLTLFVAEIV